MTEILNNYCVGFCQLIPENERLYGSSKNMGMCSICYQEKNNNYITVSQLDSFIESKSINEDLFQNIIKIIKSKKTNIYLYQFMAVNKVFFSSKQFKYIFTKCTNFDDYKLVHIIGTHVIDSWNLIGIAECYYNNNNKKPIFGDIEDYKFHSANINNPNEIFDNSNVEHYEYLKKKYYS
jgi:hypothetical protein